MYFDLPNCMYAFLPVLLSSSSCQRSDRDQYIELDHWQLIPELLTHSSAARSKVTDSSGASHTRSSLQQTETTSNLLTFSPLVLLIFVQLSVGWLRLECASCSEPKPRPIQHYCMSCLSNLSCSNLISTKQVCERKLHDSAALRLFY